MRKLFFILMTMIACTLSIQAQTHTYHGTILDAADNEPLIGATIMPIGGGNGAAADLDGNFTITVPASVKKAKISYVGYQEQTVDLRDNMIVKLSSTSQSLDDVVVVAYGSATKESLTGSVAVVGAKEIEDRPVTSVTAALEGNAPGVQVDNSVGTPGSSPSIRIRGFNSIQGSGSPLYVVDGVPYVGSVADLNPTDIESMSVLKDAASCALYGNRGANGVVLITTKKAKNVGKVDVTLKVGQGMYTMGLPFYDRLNPAEWMQSTFDANVNSGIESGALGDRDAVIGYYKRSFQTATGYARDNIFGYYDEIEGKWTKTPSNELFDSDGKFVGGSVLPGYTDLDWWDAVSRTGYRADYNVNAAAATDKFNIFASMGYMKENGYMLLTDFERFTGRINANFNPVSYLKFGVNMQAVSQNSQTGLTGSDLGLANNPFLVMFQAPIYSYYAHEADGSIMYEDGQPVWNMAGYLGNRNIGYELRHDKRSYRALVADASIYGTAVIPYGFELTVKGSIHRDKTDSFSYVNNKIGDAAGLGRLGEGFGFYKSHQFFQTLTWDHNYGLHHVDVLLDHENYQYSEDVSSVSVYGQVMPDIYALGNFENTAPAGQSIGMERQESYLARGRYNYDNRYFGELSIRRDGSSRFAKNNRWGTFWSVGASWIVSSEKFMQNVNWVDYLKLRAAYGSVGDDQMVNAYAYWALYGMASYDGTKVLIPTQRAADDIRWESTKTLDIALEGNLWNRLNFSIGYFDKRNADLLFRVVKPLSAGCMANSGGNPSVWANVGTMANHGWELAFKVGLIENRDFYWDFTLDATFLTNKITNLPSGHSEPNQGLFLGKSKYEMFTYKWAGVDKATGMSLYEMCPESLDYVEWDENGVQQYNEALYQKNLADAKADGSYVEIDGKGYTTKTLYAGRQLCGNSIPTVFGSFGTNLSWKGINLNLLFTYSLGGKIYDSNYASLMYLGSTASALHKDILNAWTEAPEGMTTDYTGADRIDPNGVPQVNINNSQYTSSESSRFLTNKNYLVFKNLNVSYDLPRKWMQAIKLQGINIGFSCENLFTLSARKGMNPQYGFAGGQGANYRPSRVYSFQLTARF